VRLLVTRPLPAGEATAARLRALGHQVTLAPLMVTEPLAWTLPDPLPEAVMLTSAVAARLASVAAVQALPTFAVGAATAQAARAAGFGDVRDGGGTAQALLDAVAAAGIGSLLHLAGADRTAVTVPAGLQLETRIVYQARLLPLAIAPDCDWVLLYSPRSAAHFAAEIDRLGVPRAALGVAAISATALAAAASGWRATAVAAAPDEDALLAAIGISCHDGGAKGQ
jgi:uroporphyrinogen-III synthase